MLEPLLRRHSEASRHQSTSSSSSSWRRRMGILVAAAAFVASVLLAATICWSRAMSITTSWSLEELRSVVGNTKTMSSLKQLKQQVRALQIADLCQSVTLSSDIDLSALAFGMEAVGLSDSAKYATTTTATAEQLAVQWLIEHSDPFVLSESNTPAHTEFRTIQRYALLTLWFAQFAKRNCNNHSDHKNCHKRQQYWYMRLARCRLHACKDQ
jgi:hypothetical protein